MPPPITDDAFWALEDELLYQTTFPLFYNLAKAASIAECDRLNAEYGLVLSFDMIDLAVKLWAQKYTYSFVKGINETSRAYLQDVMDEFLSGGKPIGNIADALEPLFGQTRALAIATTEITRVFSEGHLATWKASGLVEKKRWMRVDEVVCKSGVCPQNQKQGAIPIGDAFSSGDQAPPAHVNCRCVIVPVIEKP